MNYKGSLFAAFFLLTSLMLLGGCPKKAEMTAAPETPKESSAADAARAAEAQKAPEEARPTEEAQTRERAAASAGLKPIYFDFDKSAVRNDAAQILKSNSDWLKAHPRARIRIEGNCDERGTREYNQALGQRRSASARKYLNSLGISADRMTLLSYGKEKQVCTGHEESCMQKNRRDDFVVITD